METFSIRAYSLKSDHNTTSDVAGQSEIVYNKDRTGFMTR